jgi:hypothetical protein
MAPVIWPQNLPLTPTLKNGYLRIMNRDIELDAIHEALLKKYPIPDFGLLLAQEGIEISL